MIAIQQLSGWVFEGTVERLLSSTLSFSSCCRTRVSGDWLADLRARLRLHWENGVDITQRTRGPEDQRTRGPEDQRTRGSAASPLVLWFSGALGPINVRRLPSLRAASALDPRRSPSRGRHPWHREISCTRRRNPTTKEFRHLYRSRLVETLVYAA